VPSLQPHVRQPRWFWIPLRALLVTLLLTLISFALSLLLAILGIAIGAKLRGGKVDMTLAYRHIALPVALVVGGCVLVASIALEIRHYRQARALAGIARVSE
jgi:hypothetical protein